MKLFQFVFVLALLLIKNCSGQTCQRLRDQSGVISDSITTYSVYSKCWTIEVTQNSYARIDIKQLSSDNTQDCSQTYLKIGVSETNEAYTYCAKDTDNWKPVTALSDVNITFQHTGRYDSWNMYHTSSFQLKYYLEDLICVQKNHFRCSNHSCIHQSQVCDGVKDCQNGMDEIGCETGIFAVKDVNVSRENAIKWLKSQRSSSFDWGKNTHRAATALYLAQAASFNEENLEEELLAKQVELQTSVSLLRNSSDPLSVSELSMFVNALTVTCHNPRQFYGYDLLNILAERVSYSEIQSPGAYLTLCNSNGTLSNHDVQNLLKLLHKQSEYPFLLDVQAMTVMALTCVKNKSKGFTNLESSSKIYNESIEKFIAGQLPDGSFGNVYTTALVSQALIGSGQENNKQWDVKATVQYLMKQLNSSADFLSVYLTLPVLSGRSLLDIKAVNCANISRKQEEEISDVTDKLTGKVRIQFSLYVGDQKDVIHTIFLRMPNNSSAYDVMRVAQVADPKYKFLHRDVSGQMYIYHIAGITNDPEAGKFWLLYATKDSTNGTAKHYTQSPDKFILGDEEHLIMWYKTASI